METQESLLPWVTCPPTSGLQPGPDPMWMPWGPLELQSFEFQCWGREASHCCTSIGPHLREAPALCPQT